MRGCWVEDGVLEEDDVAMDAQTGEWRRAKGEQEATTGRVIVIFRGGRVL